MATQLSTPLMPIVKKTMEIEVRPITAEDKAKQAYRSLRIERTNKKHHGRREKRAAEKAAEGDEKKK